MLLKFHLYLIRPLNLFWRFSQIGRENPMSRMKFGGIYLQEKGGVFLIIPFRQSLGKIPVKISKLFQTRIYFRDFSGGEISRI